MNPGELSKYISDNIQGVFGGTEMEVFKEEVGKLKPDQVYLEIGVDEGKSMTVAHHYAKEGVYLIGIDINDVQVHEKSIGRGPFAIKDGLIGIGKKGFFIHGDADEFAALWTIPIDLLFLDPHHDYESIKQNALNWIPKVKKGGIVIYHDYDHEETKQWIDEYHGDNKEVFGNKIVRVIK